MAEEFVLTTITITKTLDPEHGEVVYTQADDGSDDTEPALVECLGMLRLAEDSLIRRYMGEEPDEEEVT